MSSYRDALELARRAPSTRNRYVDLLRAASIVVVVLGHWLLFAPQMLPEGPVFSNLLSATTWTHYLTWILQVMPIFFMVGGYANAAGWRSARRRGDPYGVWLRARLRRLLIPVLPLLAVWAVAAFVLLRSGIDPDTIRIASQAALVPVWFLATYVAVVALTPVTLRAWERHGWTAIVVTGALAGLIDLLSLGVGLDAAAYVNYVFVWCTVHSLGYAWADARIGGVTQRLAASVSGLAATAALVAFGPYPVAMVGLDTAGVTNSQPPKVTLVTLAVFQAGLLLAVEGPARRWLERQRVWGAVALVSSRIMTVYLWHMTAMVSLVGILLLLDGIGLSPAVDSGLWWLTRPVWLTALAGATVPFIMAFGRFERPGADHRPAPPTWRPVLAVVATCIGLGLLAALGASDAEGLNGLALSLPFVAVTVGGIVGADRWARQQGELELRSGAL